MPNNKGVKRRIQTVKNTSKITKAMEVVSASKMKSAQNRALSTVPYADGLYRIIKKIGFIPDYKNPLMRDVKKAKSAGIIVIGPDKGFVGGMITDIMLKTSNLIKELKEKNPDLKVYGISIFKKGEKVLKSLGIENKYHFSDYNEKPTTTELTPILKVLVEGFVSEEYDEIYIVYSHFINTMQQKTVTKKLLPISFEDITENGENSENISYTFEPSMEAILDKLIPEYFEYQIFAAIMDSMASEQSARMVAMKNASDNAKEIEKNLQLKYNKTRQASITQEIIEVVSGSLA